MRGRRGKGRGGLLIPPLLFCLGAAGCFFGMGKLLPALEGAAQWVSQAGGIEEAGDLGEDIETNEAPVFLPRGEDVEFDPFAAQPVLGNQPEPVEQEGEGELPPVPENPVEILEEQFSFSGMGDMYIPAGKGYIRNMTSSLSRAQVSSEVGKKPEIVLADTEEPQVLIIHTHATESYEKYDVGYGDADYAARSDDNAENVVAVGDVIAAQLEEAGIGVIHDGTQHDNPSYNGSYDRSMATVEAYLEEYPSIRVVLDIHRDAIEREGGVRVKPTVKIDGKKAAQVMVCVGCGSDSARVPEYRHNLRFGAMLQNALQTDYPGLARPLYLCDRNYNLHLTKGSLLIEMGGHANTLEEAKYSGEMVGKALVKVLRELEAEEEATDGTEDGAE